MDLNFRQDIETIDDIAAVPTILDVVCRSTGMGFAAIARVTDDRWIACSVLDNIDFGLEPGGELKVETTLCHEVRQSGDVVVINNVSEDEVYCGHPTPAMYGFQSYISMPIILPNGEFFGTLCAIDPSPAKVNTPEILGMFKLFAELIAYHIDGRSKLRASEARLLEEQESSKLREEFIAVLGHDLRNPLSSIKSGTKLLMRTALDERSDRIVRLMQASVTRMDALIDNVLDFARGRLGGGFSLQLERKPVEPAVAQVIDEIRAGSPERVIETEIALDGPVTCDHGKISQLLSNLLGNAITHGGKDEPIRVRASGDDGEFVLSVANSGPPIPETIRQELFQPFRRGAGSGSLHGLGLGLHISSQIAKAHGGTLDVASDDAETRFTFRMPTDQADREAR